MQNPAENKILKRNTAFFFISIVIMVNVIGILLRYSGLDTYFIIVGFRFQLSLFLPAIIIYRKYSKDFITGIFRNPLYKRKLFFIYILIIPLFVLVGILFLLKKIELGEPEYFYEFGISSIIDLPVYLVWNSGQLLLFFFFFIYLVSVIKLRIPTILLIFVLLFVYEMIPLKKENFNFVHLISLALFAVITGLLVKYYQNVYWLIFFTFSVLWIHFLLFGSNSEMAVNLLFASQYNYWEGFFSAGKELKAFILPAHLLFVNIFILINLLTKKSHKAADYRTT